MLILIIALCSASEIGENLERLIHDFVHPRDVVSLGRKHHEMHKERMDQVAVPETVILHMTDLFEKDYILGGTYFRSLYSRKAPRNKLWTMMILLIALQHISENKFLRTVF